MQASSWQELADGRNLREDPGRMEVPLPGKQGNTVDFLLRARRNKAAAQRYFEKSIQQNGVPETVTIDKSGANLAALHAVNAGRDTLIKIRQVKYLNNVVEVRHEVAYRSCSHFSRYRRSEPPVSPGESRSLNQERL
jgi:putative transposase